MRWQGFCMATITLGHLLEVPLFAYGIIQKLSVNPGASPVSTVFLGILLSFVAILYLFLVHWFWWLLRSLGESQINGTNYVIEAENLLNWCRINLATVAACGLMSVFQGSVIFVLISFGYISLWVVVLLCVASNIIDNGYDAWILSLPTSNEQS